MRNKFVIPHFSLVPFTVSDFTETLAQLYEKHAEELQLLVSNYRKKNGELRKEVNQLIALRCKWWWNVWLWIHFTASTVSVELVSCLGNISAGGRSRFTINKWIVKFAIETSKCKFWLLVPWIIIESQPTIYINSITSARYQTLQSFCAKIVGLYPNLFQWLMEIILIKVQTTLHFSRGLKSIATIIYGLVDEQRQTWSSNY